MILTAGAVQVETNLQVKALPLSQTPVNYPFFKMNTEVTGTGMNVSKALKTLGDEVELITLTGDDEEGKRALRKLKQLGIGTTYSEKCLSATPVSLQLYDRTGKRQSYYDLKDIQGRSYETGKLHRVIRECEAVVLSNDDFNKSIIKTARKNKKLIISDVQVIHDTHDGFNRPFMEESDILFFSGENLPCQPLEFVRELEALFHNEIIVVTEGEKGALMYIRKENRYYHINSQNIRPVINPLGAGSALMAGFTHYYLKKFTPTEALKRGQVLAAYKTGEKYQGQGFIGEEKVEELMKQADFEERILN